jgi:hypothetical protein
VKQTKDRQSANDKGLPVFALYDHAHARPRTSNGKDRNSFDFQGRAGFSPSAIPFATFMAECPSSEFLGQAAV